MTAKRIVLSVSFVLLAFGFLVPFWPLSVLGIALAAGGGFWFAGLLFGLLLDIAYGMPSGWFHFLYIPFTLFALCCAILRIIVLQHVRKASQNTLY